MRRKNVRHVSDIVGEWGLWQFNITFFSVSISLFSALNNLSVSFYAPTVKHWCADSNTTGPTIPYNNETQSIDGCLNGCQNWQFDKSVFKSTIIDEWNLVCDRSHLASMSQSLYMFGYVLGAVIFGYLSDRYGRRPIIWISIIIEILAGISSALSVNIIHFMISRVILAFASNGRLLSTFMLVNECVGPKYRATLGMFIQVGWAVGYCLLPAIAYVFPNFRHMILATSIPEVLWLVWLIAVPESPRWQITHRRWDRAEHQLMKAVIINKLPLDDIHNQFEVLKNSISEEESKLNVRTNCLDLLKTPNLRRSTLIMYFTWFVNSFVYYGISLNIGDFGGNLFVSFFIAGLIEFPSYLFPIFAFKYLGRRPVTAGLMYFSGLSCFAIIPFISYPILWLRITVAMIGKFFITSSYGVVYVYAAEIYPTVIRQVGVGSCSVAARVGSMLAPFVKDLNVYTGMGVVLSLFGTLSMADGIAIHFLPETRGQHIADTLEEAELLNRRKQNTITRNDNEYSF